MKDAKSIALQSYKEGRLSRRRTIAGQHAEGHYMGGAPILQGKTKKQGKEDKKQEAAHFKTLSPEEQQKHKREAFKRALQG